MSRRRFRLSIMNYFEYFSEIEERFSQRRGSILLLSTLDWALIETWREAGIPLEAVLRGIDAAFDKYEQRSRKAGGRLRKVNGLAWCAQAVMRAAEEMVEASTGVAPRASRQPAETGFEPERVAAFLEGNAGVIEVAAAGEDAQGWRAIAHSTALRLRELAETVRGSDPPALDELDRTLTVLEEKLLAQIQASASEAELVELKAQSDHELAPYRARMATVQLRQVQQQFLHKRLLEVCRLPRLSLFYMSHV
ncbi:MAG: hypothetical protein ACP5E5_12060 [Acidobacteriaceae bacterium]